MALMGGFAMIDNNQVTILVNEAERATEIDPDEELFRWLRLTQLKQKARKE